METLVRYGLQVQEMYEAYQKGDIPAILSALNKDVIWEVMGQPDVPFAGIYHGPADVREFFGKLNDHVEPKEFVTEHILENEHIVVATGHMNAKGRKTGRNFSTTWSMIWEFNDAGEVIHFRDCFDTLAFARGLAK
ncbi:MAG: nuclear transport factor 2 family protein [Chitinophagaceae bacterium]|nr:nuclear transport factor 2 family protein [Chitinophagaceae bacterium]